MPSLDELRHSAAHMLAAAVQQLYPGAKLGIGPTIEHGFYYDFEFPKGAVVSEKDFPRIEKRMKEIARQGHEFVRKEVNREDAREFEKDQPYKLDLIDEFAKEKQSLTLYVSGPFTDLCRGGHADNTREIPFDGLKLHRVAGAYWRGSEKNPMLTRIYGLLFATKDELEAHLQMLAEAEKRDHKILGPQLDLFVFSDLVGPGLPLWTPRGALLRTLLNDFVWELRASRGYARVEIPHITKKELYEASGHWEKFKDDLFKITTREGHEFAMKPMNCPHHTQIYNRRQWSYRELPQRYENTTMCYRDEQSGELSGLLRVRAFTQDDAHVFCRMDHIKKEMLSIWDIVYKFYGAFGLTLKMRLSLHDPKHPEKYLGDKALWKKAEDALREIAASKKIEYVESSGEAAFYGPKLDFMAKDSIGREWQVATIQLDMNMPERFDLVCINEKGEKERIVMIHAAIMGSTERFLSVLIEHYAGAFPVWLSPVQVSIIPVAERHVRPAQKLARALREAGVRVHCDDANESVGYKIRKAEKQKVPYMVVLGDKELGISPSPRGRGPGVNSLSPRERERVRGDHARKLPIRVRGRKSLLTLTPKQFLTRVTNEIAKRR